MVFDCAELILFYLKRLGVKYVFGVPGGAVEPFFNAIARQPVNPDTQADKTIEFILARHESGAAFMADGYYTCTGNLGVCIATSGPGATNMLTGVANAYAQNIPLLVITGQPSIERFGMGALQEGSCTGIDTVRMFEPCTKMNTLVSHPSQLEPKLLKALRSALTDTPGPVHLSIPVDILRHQAKPSEFSTMLLPQVTAHRLDQRTAFDLLEHLDCANNRITLLIGEECRHHMADVISLAEQYNWLLVTTPMAKGLVNETHPLYRGIFGMGGHGSARDALLAEVAERILALGATMNEVSTAGWDEQALTPDRLVFVSSNADHINTFVRARYLLQTKVSAAIQTLLESPAKQRHNKHMKSPVGGSFINSFIHSQDLHPLKHSKHSLNHPVNPRVLIEFLNEICPPSCKVLFDAGNSFIWGIHYWRCKPTQTGEVTQFYTSLGFSTMGWAIGAAVGMALADRSEWVMCVTGDGSLLMNGQEISVAAQHKLNVLYVILNDSSLGMVKHGQRMAGAENIANTLPQVNYAAMAKAMGLEAFRIENQADLIGLQTLSLFRNTGPVLLDVIIDPEAIPPMGQRVRVLNEFQNADLNNEISV